VPAVRTERGSYFGTQALAAAGDQCNFSIHG
jgi:hypothetical protein